MAMLCLGILTHNRHYFAQHCLVKLIFLQPMTKFINC